MAVLGRPRPVKPDELLPMTNGSDASTHTLSIPRHVLCGCSRTPYEAIYLHHTRERAQSRCRKVGQDRFGYSVHTISAWATPFLWERLDLSTGLTGPWLGMALGWASQLHILLVVKVLTVFTSRYRRRWPAPALCTGLSPPHRQCRLHGSRVHNQTTTLSMRDLSPYHAP